MLKIFPKGASNQISSFSNDTKDNWALRVGQSKAFKTVTEQMSTDKTNNKYTNSTFLVQGNGPHYYCIYKEST